MRKIRNKIIFLALIPTTIVTLVVGTLIVNMTTSSSSSSLYAYEQTMRNDFDTVAMWETQTAITILNSVYEKHLKGELSIDSAKNMGAELIRNIKYGKDGYFWIDSIDGTNIVSSVRKLQGTNRINLKDADGKFIIKDFINTAKKGGGFCDYRFPKVKNGKPLPKRSYVALFKPFNWVVGTGNYVDDIDKAVTVMKDKQTAYLTNALIIIISLLAVVISIILFAGGRIAKPIKILTNKAKELSNGKLDIEFNNKSKDEVGVLEESMQFLAYKLNEIIERIMNEANKTALASDEFKKASQSISEGASHLAATTQEVASSMEQMSANIEQNSNNAQKTENISKQLKDSIIQSSQIVDETAEALNQITNEIQIINEIAAQTDILALNASVVAVAAGKHGKSFSVIANEIRKLSQNSTLAAKRINKLSKSGIYLSDKSVKMLANLVPEIEKNVELIRTINLSSSEQKIGANQINNEVTQLSRLSQKNASISQETEANAYEMSKQAKQLLKSIEFFNKKTKD